MKKIDQKEINKAINLINKIFTSKLEKKLNLIRVNGPLFVEKSSGLNDHLTGNNKATTFKAVDLKQELEIVQSLAKWKRVALKKYQFDLYHGLYVDMKAIRAYEKLDELHSIYVDQWDWEMIIQNKDRNIDFLKKIVNKIFGAMKETEKNVNKIYGFKNKLPSKITFFDSQEIENQFGSNDFEATTAKLTKKYQAIFIYKIGKILKSGKKFDLRSAEYDDWELNGDLFVYSPNENKTIELSSMGIRVNKKSLIKQTNLDLSKPLPNHYYEMIINDELPLTIGGGIGISRLNMFLLERKHIGEVQASVWNETIVNECKKKGIKLL